MKRALILANGQPPDRRLLHRVLASADWFICADGGANTAARYRCTPDLIIGDLDSVTIETLTGFRNVDVKKLKEQNSTDLEKALSAVVRKKVPEIIVLGATGGRLDHAISNLSTLAKFSRKARIVFLDNSGTFCSINRTAEFPFPKGTTISLLPLTRCSGIVTRGLKWNLNDESLELGVRESTRNVIVSSPAHIKIRQGTMIAYVLTNNSSLVQQR